MRGLPAARLLVAVLLCGGQLWDPAEELCVDAHLSPFPGLEASQNPSPDQGEDQGEGPCKPRARGARCVRNPARGVKVPVGERDRSNFLSDPHPPTLVFGFASSASPNLGEAWIERHRWLREGLRSGENFA